MKEDILVMILSSTILLLLPIPTSSEKRGFRTMLS